MEYIKENIINIFEYLKTFVKWLAISFMIGIAGGLLGSFFHISIDYVTQLRENNGYLILFLPLAGLLIAWMYRLFRSKGKIDTNRVIEAVRNDEKIPLVMMPLIFIGTAITHLFGGSAGREGAALQLGGSIGYNLGKLFRFNKRKIRLLVMSGMSSVFSALFGTPLTAAVFSMEVTNVGEINHAGLVPCIFSSLIAYMLSQKLGLEGVHFDEIFIESLSILSLGKVIVLAICCALVSILFCTAIHKSESLMNRFLPNKFIQAFAGGSLIVVLTILINSQDYNGAGMHIIKNAMNGQVHNEAFLLKIIFTALTVAAGFKGGEIVPTFFIGATFGCAAAPIMGINPAFAAAIGMVTLFCCVVNCPIASIMLSLEVFGAEGLLFFALASSVGYMMSGYFGLYHNQKILYSKLDNEWIDTYTK